MDRNTAEPLISSGCSDLASTVLTEGETAARQAELREEEARWAALEEARQDVSIPAVLGEGTTAEPTSTSSVASASDHYVSRLENRVPAAFEDRSWKVEDALAGRQPTSFSGPAATAEVPPAEALRDEHTLTANRLAQNLQTSETEGLSTAQVTEHRARDGPNVLTPPPRTPLAVKFLMQLTTGFAPILWAAAVLCFLAYRPLGALGGNTPDPLNLTLSMVLVAVIFLQAFFNFYQEYKSDCVMDVLNQMLPARATTIRGGATLQIPVSELVVGDVISLGGGEKVPADIRLINVKDMKIDKSTLNGESEPLRCTVDHTDRNIMQTRNVAFFGCNVTEGTGTGIVIATGDRTVFGEIARLAATQKPEQSTLHREIQRFVMVIVMLAVSTGLVALAGWFFWLHQYHTGFLTFTQQIVNCISLIVAFVPEGMPVCVTVTLALIAKDMSKNQVLVKNLATVETLGAVSVIASDKTGTLTENKMTVSELACRTGSGNDDKLLSAMALCNRAKKQQNETGETIIVGDASETALLRYYMEKSEALRKPAVDALRHEWPTLAELPFNSTNKYMLSIHRVPGNGDKLLLMKGAPEKILERCSAWMSGGQERHLSSEDRASVQRAITMAASQGQRILGFCSRELAHADFGDDYVFDVDDFNFPTKDLVFMGWVALRDPPRAGVSEAVAKLNQAHVRVAMVTGDMKETAQAIARQVGIIKADSVHNFDDLYRHDFDAARAAVILTGPELERMDPLGWERVCTYKEAVFARTTPKQKLEIVKAFQARGECVAVTGDGVNDSPALRQADCGIAMGSGSEVSKEAADLIILDDRFTNVVLGVEHGRRCFANLKKVIIYLLPAGSWSEMLPVMTNVFLGMPLALSSFLMIVICCCTDVGPSLAMVYEKPESSIMREPPRKIGRDHLVTGKIILNAYLFIGMIEAGIAYATFFSYMACREHYPSNLLFKFEQDTTPADDIATGQCFYFYALVVMQFGNALTSRTAYVPAFRHSAFRGPGRNLRFLLAFAVSAAVFFMTCYVPFIQDGLNTRSLTGNWQPLLIPWLGAGFLVCSNEARKFISELYPGSCVAKLAWT